MHEIWKYDDGLLQSKMALWFHIFPASYYPALCYASRNKFSTGHFNCQKDNNYLQQLRNDVSQKRVTLSLKIIEITQYNTI